MWTLAVGLALAAEPPVPRLDGPVLPFPTELPWRGADFQAWQLHDQRGLTMGRAGQVAVAGGAAASLLGAAMVSSPDDGVRAVGVTSLVVGVPSVAVGPAIALGGSMRSGRALRERGVRVSRAPAVVGWTLYGATPMLLGVGETPTLGILSFLGATTLAVTQQQINRRQRLRSGLSSRARP